MGNKAHSLQNSYPHSNSSSSSILKESLTINSLNTKIKHLVVITSAIYLLTLQTNQTNITIQVGGIVSKVSSFGIQIKDANVK